MIQQNFIELYEKSFKEHWDRPALTDYFKKETFSYKDVSEQIFRLHILFEKLEVKRGDKIALIGRASPRWGVAFIASITYGAVIVPILADFNANDVQHIVNHSDSVVLFVGEHFYETLEQENLPNIKATFSLTDFKPYFVQEQYHYDIFSCKLSDVMKQRYPQGLQPSDVKFYHTPNSELILLNYTSGTTGFSKGVMLNGNSLAGNVLFGHSLGVHFPGSRALAFLPLAHAYGCAFDFLYPLTSGSHVTMLGKIPAPKVISAALAQVRPNVIFTVPLIIEKIYKKQILPMLEKQVTKVALMIPLLDSGVYSIIRNKLVEFFGGEFSQMIIGGAALNSDVENFLMKIKFPFTVGYGMTECGPLISYTNPSEFKTTSCGRILPDIMEVKITDKTPETGIGEICVRGENVMMGYYKNPEATNDSIDSEGWLHTGDIGTVSADNTIFIRGRSKTMILRANGQNIYPEEIESKMNNMPCVMESLVKEKDGKLIAMVYPDYDGLEGIDTRNQAILIEIMKANIKALNKLVAPYEQISDVELYPSEFEKTPKKSIKRYLYTR
ncbi:MAG: AMP-binding protein [Rikenellaceae bacterium]